MMEFKSFDDYVKHRLSQEEISKIKKRAQKEFETYMKARYDESGGKEEYLKKMRLQIDKDIAEECKLSAWFCSSDCDHKEK